MNSEDIILHETARKEAYKGFSECFHLPHDDLGFLLESLERQLRRLESAAAPAVARAVSEFRTESRMDEFFHDFTRLFIGPYGVLASPYGSVYLEGERKIIGESTKDVAERYLAAGIVLGDHFKDAPDHIAVELEFLYFLISKEIESIYSETKASLLDTLFHQKIFLQQHLGRWVEAFSKNVQSHARTAFYGNLAAAVRGFITEDMAYLGGIEPLRHNA